MIVAEQAASEPRSSLPDVARRRRVALLLPVVLGLACAVGAYATLPARYVAEAVVALDARKVQVLTVDAVVSRLPQENAVLRTELDLIASRSMATEVAKRLNLKSVPVSPSAPNWWDRLFGGAPEPFATEPASDPAVDRLMQGLRVNNDSRSFTIFISMQSPDPAFAARAANAYADAYLEHQIAVQTAATRRASAWLGEKLDDLRERLRESETAAQAFRRTKRLEETNGLTVDGQKLAALSAELAAARSQRAGAEARLEAVRLVVRDSPDAIAFSEALGSATVQSLRTRETELVRQVADIEQSGALKSGELPARRRQLVSVRAEIDAEIGRVVASLANEVEVARGKERALASEVAALERVAGEIGQNRVVLGQLEREAAANRSIYESFLNRYKQTIEQEGLATSDASLLSRAQPPQVPTTPKLLPLLALGLVTGCAAGVGCALLRERLDGAVRSTEELERLVGAPLLGALPRRGAGGRPRAAAIARIGAALGLDQPQANRKVVLATSSDDDADERTAFCVALARSLAGEGLSVAVVDAEPGGQAVERAFAIREGSSEPPVHGPAQDVSGVRLSADARSAARFGALDEVRVRGQASALDLAGRIRVLRERFDVVLIDAPSLAQARAALQVGALADAVILVETVGVSSREALSDAVRLFALRGVRIAGCVALGAKAGAAARQAPVVAPPRPAAAPESVDFGSAASAAPRMLKTTGA
ncbi:exopolysaccharide transport family protein [Methylopila sp. 73B]|uniref:GumC family protein n=1 Tax=Methylopila sp. 73B TaxID=1120792 RepID=UPI00039F916A|nr:exopolysaccharide transport family protein [Methylopila sp. 73B]